jgi:hypothetical protein
MNRMVGGTFGVAVLGAMVATLGRSKIDQLLPALPAGARAQLAAGLGSGAAPHGVAPQVVGAGREAFVYALHYGLLLGSAVALIGAVTAWTMVARKPEPAVDPAPVDVADVAVLDARSAGQGAPATVAAAETVHV